MSTSKKTDQTAEAKREAGNAYRRKYRAEHPEKALQWRLNYAKRLLERQAQANDGGDQHSDHSRAEART